MDQFTIKGKVICDTEINGQPLSDNSLNGMSAVEDWQAFTDAQDDSIDSIKNNNALMKEFGNIMPEMLKNFRAMNDIVARTNQNLPAIGHIKTSEELKQKRIDDYSRQGLVNLFNNGSNIVQSYANGNVSGMALSGVNAISNTTNNLSKMAETADMANLAKGLVAGGVVAAIAGAVIKGGDALASKFIEEMPIIYGTGRAFGSTSDFDSMTSWMKINEYNKGTGLDVDTFQGLAQSLRKQGVGNNLSRAEQLSLAGSIAQTTGRWAYYSGGDAGQFANLAGIMSRYGGSSNVAGDFDYIMSAGLASGLNRNQLPEFLSGIQKVMEDGIAKGFTRSSTEVADTLLMFSKMSGNNAFWQGEQGAKLLNQMNSGLASATGMSKTTDILAYRAIAQAYNGKQEDALKELYLDDGGYVNNMMLLEQGLNKNNFGSVMGAIVDSSTSTEGQIERIREMFGVNYTGASRILQLYNSKGGKVTDTDINDIIQSPENQNKETRNQEAINDIKTAVVAIGEDMAELKIEGMELVSSNVQRIADFIVGDADAKEADKQYSELYKTLTPAQKAEFNDSLSLTATSQERLALLKQYIAGGVGVPESVNSTKLYSDYASGKLKKKIRWGTVIKDLNEMPKYIDETYGSEILSMFGGDTDAAKDFMAQLQKSKKFTDKVVQETKDKSVTKEEKQDTINLLKEIKKRLDEGFTMTQTD
ncbi:MAG: hypothetical protein J6W16_07265 [Methanobrevibacter sp.]|nr:hypothetical protein [Methanobrevibacter sp.]MBP5785363.1 hypothetical protein [Methanobrevibacter sp.]